MPKIKLNEGAERSEHYTKEEQMRA
jgi:hypothetical protein